MTGQDLINWIKEHNARNLIVIVEHRDSGGTYHTAEELESPSLCLATNESYGVINKLDFNSEHPNRICL